MSKNTKKNKLLCLTLAVAMIIGLLPAMSVSAGPPVTLPTTTWTDAGNYATGFAAGSGDGSSPEQAYLISNAAELAYFARQANTGTTYAGKYIELTADIDLGAHLWPSIAWTTNSRNFSGNFDGKGYVVRNMYISKTDNQNGLFGRAIAGSTIKNVGVTGYVSGANYVGGIAGLGNGVVENCYSEAIIEGTGKYVGGIVGGMNVTASVSNCYNTGNVSTSATASENFVGGIVGGHVTSGITLTVSNCYNSGNVRGNAGAGTGYVAGIVGGRSSGSLTIEKCFNMGSLTGFTNNTRMITGTTANGTSIVIDGCGYFADATITVNDAPVLLDGTNTSGATAYTSAQLQTASTYTGWDFTNTWEIIDGNYPTLKIFNKGGSTDPDPYYTLDFSNGNITIDTNQDIAGKKIIVASYAGTGATRTLIDAFHYTLTGGEESIPATGFNYTHTGINTIKVMLWADMVPIVASKTISGLLTARLSKTSDVAINSEVDVIFGSQVEPSTIGGISLKKGGTSVSANISVASKDPSGKTVTVSPQATLSYDSTYTVEINANVKDVYGNTVKPAPLSLSFTTSPDLDPDETPQPGDMLYYGEELYNQDFSGSESVSDLFSQTDGLSFTNIGGGRALQIVGSEGRLTFLKDKTPWAAESEYIVSADFIMNSAGLGTNGYSAGIAIGTDTLNYYHPRLDSGPAIALRHRAQMIAWFNGTAEAAANRPDVSYPFLFDTPYKLSAVVRGKTIDLYVDDQFVISKTYSSNIPNELVGFRAFGCTAVVTNISVHKTAPVSHEN